MRILLKIVLAAFVGFLGYLLGSLVANGLFSAYESTGGVITAKDAFELKVTPVMFALLGCYAGWKLGDELY